MHLGTRSYGSRYNGVKGASIPSIDYGEVPPRWRILCGDYSENPLLVGRSSSSVVLKMQYNTLHFFFKKIPIETVNLTRNVTNVAAKLNARTFQVKGGVGEDVLRLI